jgi:hypothetical protein
LKCWYLSAFYTASHSKTSWIVGDAIRKSDFAGDVDDLMFSQVDYGDCSHVECEAA